MSTTYVLDLQLQVLLCAARLYKFVAHVQHVLSFRVLVEAAIVTEEEHFLSKTLYSSITFS